MFQTETPGQSLRGMLKFAALFLLLGLGILGLGIDAIELACTPGAPAAASPGANAVPLLRHCNYQSSRLWGLWTTQSGTVPVVLALEGHRTRTAKGGDAWALQLRTPGGSVTISPHAAAPIAPRVFQAFEAHRQSGQPFAVRSFQVDPSVLLLCSPFLVISLFFLAASPVCLRPVATPPGVQGLLHMQCGVWLVGRDDSFISLGLFGIPVWLGLVAVYVLGCFALVSLADWLPPNTANHVTPAYCDTTPLGLELTHPASVLDRLTFRECGWYRPLLGAPLPLWLLGGVITLIILKP